MKTLALSAGAAFAAALVAGPAAASTVVTTACTSVASASGCLFDGNINSNPNAGNVNSYKNAEAAYNAVRDPNILLTYITDTDDANFGTFGSFTGAGTASGTWSLPGFLVSFVAVKASDQFVLYQITPASSGTWNTSNIPFKNNPHAISHLVFFGTRGTAVPEPASWAMMLGGFGLLGAVTRRRQRVTVTYA
ncbi:MAG: PEP-CTERM sorting domain-containing protein [Proteobacteria bacterium]|nr:PEP-CTERM sorting domain-containing protein [Pseudomonadota bacterium]